MTVPQEALPQGGWEKWDVDGVSLHRLGWHVETVGGARYDTPPMIGEDRQNAGMAGEVFTPKLPGARVLELGMWVLGADAETGGRVDDARLEWNENWDQLRSLLFTPRREVVLTRRTWRRDGTGQPHMLTVEGLAQLSEPMRPAMTGRTRARFTVALKMTHPYFYGPEISSGNITVGQEKTVVHPGGDIACWRHAYVYFVGPLTNPRVTNAVTGTWCGMGGLIKTVAAGETVTLDIGLYRASSHPSGQNRIGDVANAGAPQWLHLAPGQNRLRLTADAGTGYAVVKFRPNYI